MRLFDWDLEQIAWRRHTIQTLYSGDTDLFRREFPATDSEAFLRGGGLVFDTDALLTAARNVEASEPVFEGELVETGAQRKVGVGPRYVNVKEEG